MTDYARQPIADAVPVSTITRRSVTWVPILLLSLVVVGLGSFGAYSIVQAHHDITRLQRQVVQLQPLAPRVAQVQSTMTADGKEISDLQNQTTSLMGQVASISTPSDPLSAYNQICTTQNTNGATGVIQTFYYPCTNRATPAPGG